MNTVMLKGDRIRLRPLKQEDIPLVVAWRFDPEVLRWVANSNTVDSKTKIAATKEIKSSAAGKNDKKIFIIEIKTGGLWEPIGDCELHLNKWNRFSAVFSICVDPNYWRNGCGTKAAELLFAYAFEKMRIHRIESHVAEYNAPSMAFHRKFGFIEEGRQKEVLFRNGQFCDRIIFRLLESEWEDLKKKQNDA